MPARAAADGIGTGERGRRRCERCDPRRGAGAEGTVILELEPQAADLDAQLGSQLLDLDSKIATSRAKAEAYEQNVIAYDAARDAAVLAADELIEAAKAKWDAKKRLVPGYEAKLLQAELDYERQKALFVKGIKPEKEIEKLKKDVDVAQSDLEAAQLDVTAAEDEWQAKQGEQQKLRKAQAKVDYSKAMKQDALGQLATSQKERRDLEIKLAELDRMVIKAPRDGTISGCPCSNEGERLEEGDSLFTLVPDTRIVSSSCGFQATTSRW